MDEQERKIAELTALQDQLRQQVHDAHTNHDDKAMYEALRALGAVSAKKRPVPKPGTIELEDGKLARDANERQQRWYRHTVKRTDGEPTTMQSMAKSTFPQCDMYAKF